jgi:hypothetical protein
MIHLKTDQGHLLKNLIDLFYNADCRTVLIQFEPQQVRISGSTIADNRRLCLIQTELDRNRFLIFSSVSNTLSFTTSHLFSVLKSVRRKDTVDLQIAPENPCKLSIQIAGQKGKSSVSSLCGRAENPVDYSVPEGFDRTAHIQSIHWKTSLRQVNGIAKTLNFTSLKNHCVKIVATDGIREHAIVLGENQNDVSKDELTVNFQSSLITPLSKLSGLGDLLTVSFYGSRVPNHEYSPMKLGMVYGLGNVDVFVKSEELLVQETREEEDEE